MARQTVADTMSQAMLSNVIEKLSEKDLNKAVKEAKNYIDTFESGSKDVKEGFAGTLGILYILQALALRVMSDEKNDTSLREKSEKSIKKALTIVDKQGEEDREYAKKLVEIIRTPEKADRSLIKKFLEVSMASAKTTKKSAGTSDFSFGDWISDFNVVERLITTGVGILACGLGVLFGLLVIRLPGFLAYLFVVPCYVLIYAGLDGWDWLSEYDIATYAGLLKIFCFLILAFTGIGTIAVLYWIGNGVRDRLGF